MTLQNFSMGGEAEGVVDVYDSDLTHFIVRNKIRGDICMREDAFVLAEDEDSILSCDASSNRLPLLRCRDETCFFFKLTSRCHLSRFKFIDEATRKSEFTNEWFDSAANSKEIGRLNTVKDVDKADNYGSWIVVDHHFCYGQKKGRPKSP